MKLSSAAIYILSAMISGGTVLRQSVQAQEAQHQPSAEKRAASDSKNESIAAQALHPIGGVKTDPVGVAAVERLRMPPIIFQTETLSVGSIAIPDAKVSIDMTTVTIHQRAVDDPFPLLKGKVLRWEDDVVAGGKRHITGIAYFNEGQLSSRLQNNDTPKESVFRSSGALEGKIIVSDRMGLMVQSKDGSFTRVDPSTISYVRSPRAFVFSIIRSAKLASEPATVVSLSFQPTTAATSISMSSVVLPKDKSLEEQLRDDDDDSIFGGKRSVRDTVDGDSLIQPPFSNSGRAKPFSNWP